MPTTRDDTTNVSSVRHKFETLHKQWVDDGRPDDEMLEILGVSFWADEPLIFGSVNEDYVKREIAWYDSRSLNVNDIPGGPPKIWRDVASKTTTDGGWILSNYGFLLYDDENYSQYAWVLEELRRNPSTRQAVAIYTRPDVHREQGVEGMYDFICTNAVHYEIRDGELCVVVQMRSNDAVFGYRNDFAWQAEVQRRLLVDLKDRYDDLTLGPIIWQAASLHIYPRHFRLVEHYAETGEYDVEL